MTSQEVQRNPVEELAEEFLARYRRGERPALNEYTEAHPELADEIRDLFPALVMMEEAGPRDGSPAGACGGAVTADGKALERLGDYRIIREVARGGMGVVYEAEQETLGRHVALKVLPFHAANDPVRLKRFRREARSAARLHHTNIVPVFDVGVWRAGDIGPPVHYFAMQFIQGQGLDEVLAEVKQLRRKKGDQGLGIRDQEGESASGAASARRDLTLSLVGGLVTGEFTSNGERKDDSAPSSSGISHSPSSSGQSEFSIDSDFHYYRSVARVGLQVAEALSYAHGQNVLHRDIKPSNLLLDRQGTVWVTDFGLAKDEGEDLTRTGDMVGTLRYMAPERFNGYSEPRSDIYSVGMTLYELLTLHAAFED